MATFLEIHRPAGVTLVVLEAEPVTVGRETTNQVSLETDPQVSRLHAVLESFPAGWCLRDLGSRNGTFVNGERVEGQRRLDPGDEIRVGTTKLVYRTDGVSGVVNETIGAQAPPLLTARERDVLRSLLTPVDSGGGLFLEPRSTREIADALFVSEAAIKQHLSNLYDKFEVHGENRRLQLANEALRRGAISLGELRAKG